LTGSMRISVIVPVLNEAEGINQLIGHLGSLRKDNDIEIIVADGDPCGSTLNEVKDDKVIRVLSKKGRGRQMNTGATTASGEILLFLHADTYLPSGAFEKIASVMRTGRYAGGAFDLGIDSGRTALRIVEQAASLRSRITRIPYGDQAIFIRRDIFQAMGGFMDCPIMEDVDLMQRLKRAGRPIIILSHKVRTSPRRWEKEGVVYCTARNWTLVMLHILGVSPEKLARFYR
jgi:rSAM/selenodomain-associated transferase 2